MDSNDFSLRKRSSRRFRAFSLNILGVLMTVDVVLNTDDTSLSYESLRAISNLLTML